MSRVNIKQRPKPKVKTIVKVIENEAELRCKKEPKGLNEAELRWKKDPKGLKDQASLLEEIENLKRELETNNEILDNTFKISHEQEDRIKQLSKRVIEKEKIEINSKTDEIEDIINKSEIMLKNIKRDSQSNLRAQSLAIPKHPIIQNPIRNPTRKIPIAIKKAPH